MARSFGTLIITFIRDPAARSGLERTGVGVLEPSLRIAASDEPLLFDEMSFNAPPCVCAWRGRSRRLTAGGLIAGAFENCKYEQETIRMQLNDLLFLYTDGLTEAMSPEGEEFGEVRLEEMLTEYSHLTAQEIRDQVAARVKQWCRGAGLYDDLTFVVMKVN